MQIIPRSYQIECVDSIFNYFMRSVGNPVCALPTGTGKSIVIAMLLERIYRTWPTQRVQVLTHVKELILQNYQKLMLLWPNAPAGINSAGLGQRDIHTPILFAGIGSVAKHAAQFGHVDLVLIDEAHLVSPNETTMYQTYLNGLRAINPHLKVIGFTATPWRLGHGRITEEGSLFTDICFDITGLESFNRLIAEGYVAPLIPRQPRAILDVEGVHMRGGDYIASELQNAVDKYDITERALREALELGKDRKHWLIFAAGVDHADHIADIFSGMGEPCHAVHSKLSSNERDRIIADFKAGRVRAVVNNNVLTTGFDFPAIDLIVMLRPTASPVLWVQMLGRGTRPNLAKENCLVLDFAGNTRRLGPINDPVIPRKKGAKGGHAPIKLCEACQTLNHASVKFCICCGAEFHFQTKLKEYASTQELIKGDTPIVEVFEVDHITCRKYQKQGRPDSIKVTYYCNLQAFSEYVCLEHDGYAARKAKIWWRDRARSPIYENGVPVPGTTAEALLLLDRLQVPTHLRIWINKQYPEILAHCFDGTAFGTKQISDSATPPSVEIVGKVAPPSERRYAASHDLDDDIPF